MANVLIVLYFFLKAKKAPPNNNKHVFWWFMMTTDFKATELCQHWCVQLRGKHQNYKHRYLSQVFSPALDRDMIVFGDVNIERCCCYRHGVVFQFIFFAEPPYFCPRQTALTLNSTFYLLSVIFFSFSGEGALILSLTNSTHFDFGSKKICNILIKAKPGKYIHNDVWSLFLEDL